MVKLTRMFPLLALIVGVMLSVLPAEGQTEITSGTATGIQRPGATGVTIQGFHDSGVDAFFPNCRASAVVFAVINTDPVFPFFFQSDVFGANDGLVLTLIEEPKGNNGTVCRYQGNGTINPPSPIPPPGIKPGFPQVDLTLGKVSGTKFSFTLQYRQGTYVDGINPPPGPWQPTTPRGFCPAGDTPPGKVFLSMEFRLIGPPALPPVADRVEWCSRGSRSRPCDFLDFPPGPCR